MTPSAEGQEAPAAFFDALVAQFAHRHPRLPKWGKRLLACRRLTMIERLIWWRHGGAVDTDEGAIYYEAALPYLAAIGRMHDRPILPAEWAQRVTPRFYAEMGPAWFTGQELRAGRDTFPTADQIGRQLAVTAAEVRDFGLTTVGAVDRPKHVRLAERKEKDRERKRLARLAAGMTPRAASLVAMKPWTAAGMKRSAWYAAGKPVALALQPRTDLSAPIEMEKEGVRTKSSSDSANVGTTTATAWELAGVSRRTWFRRKAAAAAAAAVPDLDHANDDCRLTSARTIKVELVKKVPSNSNNKNSSKAG